MGGAGAGSTGRGAGRPLVGFDEMTFLVGGSTCGAGSGASATGDSTTGAGSGAGGSATGAAGAGSATGAGASSFSAGAAAFFEPFFAGSSGCWSRISPSRSALRRTWSA